MGKVINRYENFSPYQYNNDPFQKIRFPILKNLLKEADIMLQIRRNNICNYDNLTAAIASIILNEPGNGDTLPPQISI